MAGRDSSSLQSDSVMAHYSDNSECDGQKKHEFKV